MNRIIPKIIISLLLAGITLAIYWPVGHYAVVFIDDTFFTDNPEVQSGLNAQSFIWAMTGVVAANWHPVTTLSFVLTHQFFGTNAGADHLVNLGFHAANAALLFLVLQYLVGLARCANPAGASPTLASGISEPPAGNSKARAGTAQRSIPTSHTVCCAVVAGLFAWHPLRVESVAWIAERKDVLCGFFFLLTLWAWGRYAEGGGHEAKGGKLKLETGDLKSDLRPLTSGFYWLALSFFALALLSKAMAVTLPFLLLLLDLWPLGRVQSSEFRV